MWVVVCLEIAFKQLEGLGLEILRACTSAQELVWRYRSVNTRSCAGTLSRPLQCYGSSAGWHAVMHVNIYLPLTLLLDSSQLRRLANQQVSVMMLPKSKSMAPYSLPSWLWKSKARLADSIWGSLCVCYYSGTQVTNVWVYTCFSCVSPHPVWTAHVQIRSDLHPLLLGLWP